MKKISLCFLMMFYFSASESQDLLGLRLDAGNGESQKHIFPKTILLSGTNRIIVYNRRETAPGSPNNIGVAKIDASNHVIFDTRIDIDEPGIYVVDAEILDNYVYLLFGTSTNRVLTTRVYDDGWVDNPTVTIISDVTSFTPTDLYMGWWDHNTITQQHFRSMAILGYSGSKIISLFTDPEYFSPMQPRLNFDIPGVTSYENLKFNYFAISDGVDVSSMQISGKANPLTGGFSFRFNPYSQQITDAYNYNINNAEFGFFKRMSFDGYPIFYGQLKGGNITDQNGDMFLIYQDGNSVQNNYLVTFSNPYFHAVAGDAHSEENNPVNFWETFSGYYFDPADPRNPSYALGLIDALSGWATLSANTYALKTPYVPGAPLETEIGATTCNYLTGDRTAILDRHIDDANPYSMYYLKNTVNSSCNNSIGFTQTFNNTYSVTALNVQYIPTLVLNANPGSTLMTYHHYSSSFQSLFPVCIEKTTNSVPNHPPLITPCNPGDPCWNELPAQAAIKKKDNHAAADENFSLDVTISPNPIITEMIIRSAKPIKAILVYDVAGKVIVSRVNISQKQLSINVDNISPGTYFAKVTKIDGTISIQKLIKL